MCHDILCRDIFYLYKYLVNFKNTHFLKKYFLYASTGATLIKHRKVN